MFGAGTVDNHAVEMIHTEGRFRSADQLELYFQAWKPIAGSRGAIVIVHGFGEHSGRYHNVVAHLISQNYSVYGFDLRGHGRSPGQRGFINAWHEYRDDLNAFLTQIRQESADLPIFLYSHSMGGIIALDFCLQVPSRLNGLICSAPAIGKIGISPTLVRLAKWVSQFWPRFAMPVGLDITKASRDPQVAIDFLADRLNHPTGTARLATETLNAVDQIHNEAANLKMPVLILHGEADVLAQPDGSRKLFENITFQDKELLIYPDAYHELHNDIIKDQVLSDMIAWIDQHL